MIINKYFINMCFVRDELIDIQGKGAQVRVGFCHHIPPSVHVNKNEGVTVKFMEGGVGWMVC